MTKTFAIIYLITCALSLRVQVIDYAIDPSFNSELLFNRGSVSDILHTSADEYFVMGMFMGLESPVFTGSIIDTQGNLVASNVVGGQRIEEFMNGYLQYGQILRCIEVPGGLTSFQFEFQKPEYSGFLSNNALDALILPGDCILVAGRFFTDTSVSAESLRQLCLIDSTGAPVPGFPMVHCAQPVDAEINFIDTLTDGSYIVSGTFAEINGNPYNKLAKLNSDFIVDNSFENIFLDAGGGVAVKLIDSQDRIWVRLGANVTVQNSVETEFLRLLPNGQIDPEFLIPEFTTILSDGSFYPTGPSSILEDVDGTFILSGNFVTVNGLNHSRLVKIDDEGNVIENAFSNLGADEAIWGDWSPLEGEVVGTYISKMTRLQDGKILLGGQFSSFGGEPYSCLVRLKPDGFVNTEDIKDEKPGFRVFPNPAKDRINVLLDDFRHPLHFEILNPMGMKVKEGIFTQSTTSIKLGNLPNGLYIIQIAEKGVAERILVVSY